MSSCVHRANSTFCLQQKLIKVKLKFTLKQARKAQTVSRGISLLFLLPRCYMGVGGQSHTPAALPPGKRPDTHCIGGWVGPMAGLDGHGKSCPHRDSIPGPSSP